MDVWTEIQDLIHNLHQTTIQGINIDHNNFDGLYDIIKLIHNKTIDLKDVFSMVKEDVQKVMQLFQTLTKERNELLKKVEALNEIEIHQNDKNNQNNNSYTVNNLPNIIKELGREIEKKQNKSNYLKEFSIGFFIFKEIRKDVDNLMDIIDKFNFDRELLTSSIREQNFEDEQPDNRSSRILTPLESLSHENRRLKEEIKRLILKNSRSLEFKLNSEKNLGDKVQIDKLKKKLFSQTLAIAKMSKELSQIRESFQQTLEKRDKKIKILEDQISKGSLIKDVAGKSKNLKEELKLDLSK